MEFSTFELVLLIIVAVIFFWLFTGRKLVGKKNKKVDENEKVISTSSVIWAAILFSMGYNLRKTMEQSEKIVEEGSLTLQSDFGSDSFSYWFAVILLVLAFIIFAKMLKNIICYIFVHKNMEQIKDTQLWKEYQEFKTYLYPAYDRLGYGFHKRLNKDGLLKFDKELIFRIWLIDDYEEGDLKRRIKKTLFYISACLIFFPLAYYFYDGLFTWSFLSKGEYQHYWLIESVFTVQANFVELNNSSNVYREIWLETVWVTHWFLIVITPISIYRFIYDRIWVNYYNSIVQYDDLDYYYFRAKKHEENREVLQAISYWKELKKFAGDKTITLGLTQGSDYPMETFYKEKIEKIIEGLEK